MALSVMASLKLQGLHKSVSVMLVKNKDTQTSKKYRSQGLRGELISGIPGRRKGNQRLQHKRGTPPTFKDRKNGTFSGQAGRILDDLFLN